MSHALSFSPFSFGVARFALGLSEAAIFRRRSRRPRSGSPGMNARSPPAFQWRAPNIGAVVIIVSTDTTIDPTAPILVPPLKMPVANARSCRGNHLRGSP